jgi:hypothetical protein
VSGCVVGSKSSGASVIRSNVIREPLLSVPETLCNVDRSVFEELKDINSSSSTIDMNFMAEVYIGHPKHRKAAVILAELTEQLLEYSVQNFHKTPYGIHYSISTSDVPVGKTQRADNWHYDGASTDRTCAVTVASNIPTEFLIARGTAAADTYVHRISPESNSFQNAPIDAGLVTDELAIYIPNNYQAVMMTEHVHRSPLNATATTQPRVWLRGLISGSR